MVVSLINHIRDKLFLTATNNNTICYVCSEDVLPHSADFLGK